MLWLTLFTLMSALYAENPNIVYIHVDSMDGRTLFDESPALTPNLKKLQSHGVTFANTYSASPECVPSRSTLWSGKRVDRTETWNNGRGLDISYPIAMDRVNATGYDTKFLGRRDFNWYGDSFSPHKEELRTILADHNLGAHSISANLSSWLRSVPNMNLPWEYRPKATVHHNNNTDVHIIDWHRSKECVKYLGDRKNNPKPFFLSCGFICPHPAYVTSEYWHRVGVNESRVTLPGWTDYDEKHAVQKYEADSKNITYWQGPQWTWSNQELLAIRHVYYAMVAEADAFVGKVLDTIDFDNTVVFFWSDHGDMAMTHHQFYKESTFEGSSRVPLVIAGPGIAKNKVVHRPTSLLDMFPTVMDLTGTAHPPDHTKYSLDGFSLVPDLETDEYMYQLGAPNKTHPDWVLSQWHGDHTNTAQYAIRRGQWKYIRYEGFGHALYNLAVDPDELQDVSKAANNTHVISELDALIHTLFDPATVDTKAKTCDKKLFQMWRQMHFKNEKEYEKYMQRPNLRWHKAYMQDPKKYLQMIETWLRTPPLPPNVTHGFGTDGNCGWW